MTKQSKNIKETASVRLSPSSAPPTSRQLPLTNYTVYYNILLASLTAAVAARLRRHKFYSYFCDVDVAAALAKQRFVLFRSCAVGPQRRSNNNKNNASAPLIVNDVVYSARLVLASGFSLFRFHYKSSFVVLFLLLLLLL